MGSLVAMTSMLAALALSTSTAGLPRSLGTLVIIAGPGLAWVPLLELPDRALEALVSLLLSVASVILVAQVVTYASGFSWKPCEFLLLAVTIMGLLAQGVVALARAPISE